jgi:hypothetical protein
MTRVAKLFEIHQPRPPRRSPGNSYGYSPEHHGGIARGVFNKGFSTQKRIKYKTRVGLLDIWHRRGTLDATGVGRTGFAEIREMGVVPRTICVAVLVRDVCCRGMGEVIPEERDDLILDEFADFPTTWNVGHDI